MIDHSHSYSNEENSDQQVEKQTQQQTHQQQHKQHQQQHEQNIIENMTETFKQATRISGITAPITIVGEEDEQSFTGGTAVKVSSSVSVDDDGDNDDDNGDLIRNHRSDANSNSSSSSSSGVDSQLDSDDEESYNSESTRSCTFSIYCLMHEDGAFEDGSTGDDDCSSISTVSNFVREKEDEEAYYNNLDDSFTYASCSDSDADDEDSENDCDVVEVLKSQTEKSKAAAKDGERAVFDDENVSKDNSDFTSDDDDNDDDDDDDDDYYDESYDEDLDEDEDKEGDQELYDDEYGDEYGDDQEEVVEELLEESDRSQLSHSSSGPASDIVFEKNKRIFSNANSRQSHSNQMALFLKNIAETKAAVGIVDDEEPEIEVIEEEVVDEEEDETEVEYVDETEVDEDDEEDFVYEVLLSPKAKNKETRRNRLSFLSV